MPGIEDTGLPPAQTTGDKVVFTFVGLLILGNILWMNREYLRRGGLRKLCSDIDSGCRAAYASIGRGFRDIARMRREFLVLYREGRAEQLGYAPPPREVNFPGLAQALLVNSITVLGVFNMRWPVGTALALYWAENLLTGIVIVASFAVWRRVNASRSGELRTTTADVALTTILFNGAHAVFLALFLGVMLPRIAPAEQFDRSSFVLALLMIGVLLLLNSVRIFWNARTTPAAQIEQTVTSFLQRVAVLHLTIIIGMFALALFGRARAFFAVFAGLKLLVDIVNTGTRPATPTPP